jgi:hypothetical protein
MDDINNKQDTNEKLDAQTTLLKWILTGVGTGIAALAVFASSVFSNFLTRNQQDSDFLKKDLKDAVISISKGQECVSKALEVQSGILQQQQQSVSVQTALLKEIRDDQRRGAWRETTDEKGTTASASNPHQ